MIKEFQGKHRFLSNFHLCQVDYGGLIYPSAEHAYQAQKTITDTPQDENWKLYCLDTMNEPGNIKRESRKVKLRPDWDEIKLEVMKGVLMAKFSQNQVEKELLLETGEEHLQEGNTWRNAFWGVDLLSGHGENWLGKLLMEVREEIRNTNYEI